jgi:hypothetical protein
MYQVIYTSDENYVHVDLFEDSEKSNAYDDYCMSKARDNIVSVILIYVDAKLCYGEMLASYRK